MLRQMHWTIISSIEVLGQVFTVNEREDELLKLPLNLSVCTITADSKSRWPHGRKAYFRVSFPGCVYSLWRALCDVAWAWEGISPHLSTSFLSPAHQNKGKSAWERGCLPMPVACLMSSNVNSSASLNISRTNDWNRDTWSSFFSCNNQNIGLTSLQSTH